MLKHHKLWSITIFTKGKFPYFPFLAVSRHSRVALQHILAWSKSGLFPLSWIIFDTPIFKLRYRKRGNLLSNLNIRDLKSGIHGSLPYQISDIRLQSDNLGTKFWGPDEATCLMRFKISGRSYYDRRKIWVYNGLDQVKAYSSRLGNSHYANIIGPYTGVSKIYKNCFWEIFLSFEVKLIAYKL